jgi:dihydroneopterin triphosphate diphosphatase
MINRTNVQVFVFFKNPTFSVLVLKRTPERSGYWQPVCGGVENGEDMIEAALREVSEETGIEKVEFVIDLEYTFTYKETKNGILMDMQDFCFAVEIENTFDIQLSDEHEEFRWCSYREAKTYLKWEYSLIALDKLMNFI